MIRSRLGLKALALSALLLGLMVFSGGVAEAEVGAKWKVNGADVGALAPQLVIKEIENKTASLLFITKAGTHVLILCTDMQVEVGLQLTPQGIVVLGRVVLPFCTVTLNEKAAANCKPHTPGSPSGEILSERIKGLIVLDKLANGEVTELVKITPENAKGETSKLLAVLELGELCAIGESVNIEATELGEGLWIKDIGGNAGFLTESASHLITEGLSKLLALSQPAKILGSAVVELGGVHKGLKWSGVPG